MCSSLVHKTRPHPVLPPSQAAVDASVAIKRWIEEGDGEDDYEGDSEAASTTSSSRNSVTTAASSLYEPPLYPKPVSAGADPPMLSHKVAEAIYGPFPQSNDYASQAGPSAPHQEIAQDVEMGDFNGGFEDEVMIYYHAAISSSLCNHGHHDYDAC